LDSSLIISLRLFEISSCLFNLLLAFIFSREARHVVRLAIFLCVDSQGR
jgi:hypothetical protein